MARSVEMYGQNVDDAVNKALVELGVSLDDVVIDVKEEGGPGGILGLGRKQARVIVSVEDEDDEAGDDDEVGDDEYYGDSIAEDEDDAGDDTYYGDDEENDAVFDDLGELGIDFLRTILDSMDVPADYSYDIGDEHIYFDIEGEDVGAVIGRRGETLNAIQYLTSLVINRQTDEHIYVTVDVAGYRKRREKSLVSLARRTASKVIEVGKEYEMEPMSAAERRIIHSALQNFDGVRTESEGKEPNRCVIIIPTANPVDSWNDGYNAYLDDDGDDSE